MTKLSQDRWKVTIQLGVDMPLDMAADDSGNADSPPPVLGHTIHLVCYFLFQTAI